MRSSGVDRVPGGEGPRRGVVPGAAVPERGGHQVPPGGRESLDLMAEKDQGPGLDGWQDMVDAYPPMEL